jgi:HEXXH motif-containing protein
MLPSELRPAHHRVVAALRGALGADRRAMLGCFASPAVSTALQCAEIRDELPAFAARIDGATREIMPHLLLEMWLRSLIPAGQSLLWSHGAPPLVSLSLGGELIAPAGSTGLRFAPSHLTALAGDTELACLPADREAMRGALSAGGDGFRLRRFARVDRVTYFATVDHNPIAEFEEHPEKAGNHVDLGDRAEREWLAVLEASFALVETFLPREFAEMVTMLHQVIPVGYDDHRHLSASYREAVGTVYLTLHPSVMIMTEAVIHEFQHNKCNVAAHSVEFIENAFHPLYKSPVRPDPRPLWGILLAVHAFLPVAELYRRMRDARHPLAAHPDFERRMSEIDLKNREGMEMLRGNAVFTPAGRALFDELEQLEHRHMTERIARGLDTTPTEIHLA